MMARLSGRYQAHSGGLSRLLEDFGFLVGLLLIAGKGVVEILADAGIVRHANHGFPWAFFGYTALLIAPKMVGRASAGRAWEGLARVLGGRGAAVLPNARSDNEQ